MHPPCRRHGRTGITSCLARALELLTLLVVAHCASAAGALGTEAPALHLSLDDCIRLALARNSAVSIAREDASIAEAQRRQAFAAYLPTVSASAQYTRLDDARTVRYETPAAVRDMSLDTAAWWGIAQAAGTAAANAAYDNRDIDPMQTFNTARAQAAAASPAVQSQPILGKEFWEASVVLTQPLFTGGKIKHGNAMAELNQKIRELGIGVSEDDVVLSVILAYRAGLTGQQAQQELTDLLARLGALRSSIRSQLDGASEKVSMRDLARVEVVVAGTEQGLAESRRATEVAVAALRLLIGQDDRVPIRLAVVEERPASPLMALEDCEALGLARRPEMSQARSASELAKHGVSRAKAGFSPDVVAFAGWRYLDDEGDVMDPGENDEGFMGIQISVPIFEGFSRFAEVAEARSQRRRAMAVELQAQRGVLLQVREAYHGLTAARAKVEAARAMVEHAERLRAVTEAARTQYIGSDYRRMLVLEDEPKLMEFKVVPDMPDQVEADVMESNARISRLQADLELAVAQAKLARALGVRSLSEVQP